MGSVVNKRAKSKGFAFFMGKIKSFHSVPRNHSFPYPDLIVGAFKPCKTYSYETYTSDASGNKYILAWLALPIIAIFNGILR